MLYEILINFRVKMGLSQTELAEELGVTQAAISYVESHKQNTIIERMLSYYIEHGLLSYINEEMIHGRLSGNPKHEHKRD